MTYVLSIALLAAIGQAGPLVLTIDDVARLAAERNRSVQQAEQALMAALAAVEQARAAQRFTVALQAQINNHKPAASFSVPLPTGKTVSVDIIPTISWQAGIAATQPIYHGGQLYYREALARLGADVSQLELERQRREAVSQARQLFFAVLQAQEMQNVAAENVSRAARHLQDARARVEAGAAPGFDVIRAEAEVANANDGLVAARAAVEKAMAALKTLLAIPVTQEIRLQAPEPSLLEEADLQQAIDLALRCRPEVQAADTGVKLAQTRVQLARAISKPSVDLVARYQHTSSAGFAGHHWGWDVGVQLSKLIFDNGLTDAAVAEAVAEVGKAEQAAQQVREAIALEVHQAWVELREAREKIAAAEKGVREAEEAMRIADLRYQEGVAPAVEVTDARAALMAARANLINARFAYEQARVKLEHAVGLSFKELVSKPPASQAAGPGTPATVRTTSLQPTSAALPAVQATSMTGTATLPASAGLPSPATGPAGEPPENSKPQRQSDVNDANTRHDAQRQAPVAGKQSTTPPELAKYMGASTSLQQ
ncbi:MAG: TolC family protein [Armatimonadetes bacterium]|nr:TolC family protein [Armatimonadota bacterium]